MRPGLKRPETATDRACSLATSTGPSTVRRMALTSALWNRQLHHYPNTRLRAWYLGVTVVTTVILYYQIYVQGAVGTELIASFHLSFAFFVGIAIAGSATGAVASILMGLVDRWGRANIVAYGLLTSSLLTLLAIPATTTKWQYLGVYCLINIVEGATLVASPALIRDFSPQLDRASAMGFWTMGPVLGALLTTELSTHTLDTHPDWQFHFRLCGVISLAVAAIAVLFLRELDPPLRDQLMVSLHDRALIEARARGLDDRQLHVGQWRQMLTLDVLGSAFGISIYLIFYYVFIAFGVVYLTTNFGWTPAEANALGNWFWIANAITLLLTGLWSDFVKVRKPFMVVGSLLSITGVVLWARVATEHDPLYDTMANIAVLIAVGTGLTYATWMASFTETIEKHNPAATATGLAVWGGTLRTMVTLVFFVLIHAVGATNTIVDHGPRLQQIQAQYPDQIATIQTVGQQTLAKLQANPNDTAAQAAALSALAAQSGMSPDDVKAVLSVQAKYPDQIQTLQHVDPATLAALQANPNDIGAGLAAANQVAAGLKITVPQAIARLLAVRQLPAADLGVLVAHGPALLAAADKLTAIGTLPKDVLDYLAQHGPEVQKALVDSPHQWRTWWLWSALAQVLFLPTILIMSGRWRPSRARDDAREHEQAVARELAALNATEAGSLR